MLWSFAGYCTRLIVSYNWIEIEQRDVLEHNISNHVDIEFQRSGASNR